MDVAARSDGEDQGGGGTVPFQGNRRGGFISRKGQLTTHTVTK